MIPAIMDKFDHHKVGLWSFMEQARLCLSNKKVMLEALAFPPTANGFNQS